MAGRGPAPKPSHLRQRRNRKAGAATLEAQPDRKVPALPDFDDLTWHRRTRNWWRNVWRSPMAGEYLESDRDGLERLALVINEFYETRDAKLLAEIRLQEARFGLSPVDRSRLQWEVERGEEAQARRRKPVAPAPADDDDTPDPRQLLRAVK